MTFRDRGSAQSDDLLVRRNLPPLALATAPSSYPPSAPSHQQPTSPVWERLGITSTVRERARLQGPEPTIHPQLARRQLTVAWVCDIWRKGHPVAAYAQSHELLSYLLCLAKSCQILLSDHPLKARLAVEETIQDAAETTPCRPAAIARTLRQSGVVPFAEDDALLPSPRQAALGLTEHLASIPFQLDGAAYYESAPTQPCRTLSHASPRAYRVEAPALEERHVRALVALTEVFANSLSPYRQDVLDA